MEKNYEELNAKYMELIGQLKDAICERMKELGCIKFDFTRIDFPFMTCDGEFKPVDVVKLRHEEEYDDDVTAIDEFGNEWSVQEEGTVDGCMELLYYIEQKAYKVIED